MKTPEKDNTDNLRILIDQLSAITQWISDNGDIRTIMDASPRAKGTYLFGFEPASDHTVNDLERYQEFYALATVTLQEYGIKMEHNGYAYLLEAVRIVNDRNTSKVSLKTDVYPFIARKYRISNSDSIEHNIRNAIGAAFTDCAKNRRVSKMSIFDEKPSNKKFITYISDIVNRQMYDRVHSKETVS